MRRKKNTMHILKTITFSLLLIVPVFAGQNLESILNAFISTYSSGHAAWKKDIVLKELESEKEIPSGYQRGYSKHVGTYIYRPKLFSELSKEDQNDLLNDVRLKSFIVSTRMTAPKKEEIKNIEKKKDKITLFDANKIYK